MDRTGGKVLRKISHDHENGEGGGGKGWKSLRAERVSGNEAANHTRPQLQTKFLTHSF